MRTCLIRCTFVNAEGKFEPLTSSVAKQCKGHRVSPGGTQACICTSLSMISANCQYDLDPCIRKAEQSTAAVRHLVCSCASKLLDASVTHGANNKRAWAQASLSHCDQLSGSRLLCQPEIGKRQALAALEGLMRRKKQAMTSPTALQDLGRTRRHHAPTLSSLVTGAGQLMLISDVVLSHVATSSHTLLLCPAQASERLRTWRYLCDRGRATRSAGGSSQSRSAQCPA